MSEEITPEQAQATNEQLAIYGEYLYQMMNIEWFREMVECSFDIRHIVDHETKTVDIQVIETPPEVKVARYEAFKKAKGEGTDAKIITPSTRERIKFKL